MKSDLYPGQLSHINRKGHFRLQCCFRVIQTSFISNHLVFGGAPFRFSIDYVFSYMN